MQVKDLKPADYNPRKITEKQLSMLQKFSRNVLNHALRGKGLEYDGTSSST